MLFNWDSVYFHRYFLVAGFSFYLSFLLPLFTSHLVRRSMRDTLLIYQISLTWHWSTRGTGFQTLSQECPRPLMELTRLDMVSILGPLTRQASSLPLSYALFSITRERSDWLRDCAIHWPIRVLSCNP